MMDSNIVYPESWKNGGSEPPREPPIMAERIAILEHQAKTAESRMERIEDKLDRAIEMLGRTATTNGLWTMVATVVGLCAASVGVIVAILTWLQGFHH